MPHEPAAHPFPFLEGSFAVIATKPEAPRRARRPHLVPPLSPAHPPAEAAPDQTLMDLNAFGGGARCLLRLRENAGHPGISDRSFISRHLTRYPAWRARPGQADLAILCELAQELEVADEIEASRDYTGVLAEHRAGHAVLVCTERTPEQDEAPSAARRFVTLLETMDEAAFTLWCPYPNGQSGQLPVIGRAWWDRWYCVALVLRRPTDAPRAG